MVLDPDTCSNPTVLILAKYYQPYSEQVYQKGFRTVVSSIRRNSQSPLPRLKSANFLESTLAKREAKKAGVEDALFLNDKGLLAEASTSNIFLVANGVLKTPGLESGILSGITREVILELALQLDIDVVEQDVELEELFQTEEAFITNSMIEVMPLIEVNGKAIGSGKPGSVTGKLMVAYEKMVRMGER
jgi:branched-subunit amino acid aminotransferase/4-amino-4-deoxychorismate lyase